MHVGLKALPLNVHLQFRGFLHLGDMPASYIVHMHITIAGPDARVKWHPVTVRTFHLLSPE
jgi:hypothetical protein